MKKVSFVVQRDFASLEALFEDVQLWCFKRGVSERDRSCLLIVLDECLSNVIRHGAGVNLYVQLRVVKSILYVLIVDKAPPFSPMARMMRDERHDNGKEKEKEGGHGLSLVRGLTAHCHYRRLRKGNGLLLTHVLNV